MRILGIDYGTKRIGLAVSDEGASIAWELDIHHPKEFWEKLPSLIEDKEISEVVVGLPLNMSGQDSEKTTEVRKFVEELKSKINLPVHLTDERLSSAMAGNISGSNKNLDSLAAQILLQNYLNKQQK